MLEITQASQKLSKENHVQYTVHIIMHISKHKAVLDILVTVDLNGRTRKVRKYGWSTKMDDIVRTGQPKLKILFLIIYFPNLLNTKAAMLNKVLT